MLNSRPLLAFMRRALNQLRGFGQCTFGSPRELGCRWMWLLMEGRSSSTFLGTSTKCPSSVAKLAASRLARLSIGNLATRLMVDILCSLATAAEAPTCGWLIETDAMRASSLGCRDIRTAPSHHRLGRPTVERSSFHKCSVQRGLVLWALAGTCVGSSRGTIARPGECGGLATRPPTVPGRRWDLPSRLMEARSTRQSTGSVRFGGPNCRTGGLRVSTSKLDSCALRWES